MSEENLEINSIPLSDIWNGLWERKTLIFSVMAGVIIMIIMIDLLRNPVFESHATMTLGYFKRMDSLQKQWIEPLQEIEDRIQENYKNAIAQARKDGTLSISATGFTEKEAGATVTRIVSDLLNRHQSVDEKIQEVQKMKKDLAEDSMKSLNNALKVVNSTVKLREPISEISQSNSWVPLLEKAKLEVMQHDLKRRILEDEMGYEYESTRITSDVTHGKKTKPKFFRDIVWGSVLGMFLGLFAAFTLSVFAAIRVAGNPQR